MSDHDDHAHDTGDLTKLRPRMVAGRDELNSLDLPALAARMDLAIAGLDESIRRPEGGVSH